MLAKQLEINWSSELAYAVGLITTDGNLSPDGRHLAFISKDIDQIDTLKRILNLQNKVVRHKSGYTGKLSTFKMQFGDVIFYRWLIRIGLMPNKSLRLKSLKVPNKFFFDFFRGCLDGDGTILKYFDPVYKNSLRLYVKIISASLPFLKWLQERTKVLAGLHGFIKLGGGSKHYELAYAKKESIKLLNQIYYKPNVPCLNRKFEIAKQFIS